MGQLQQVNIAFDPVEDRLLLRISSRQGEDMLEYTVWLTRRMVRLLWQALERHLQQDPEITLKVPAAGREAVMAFQQEEALAQSNFSQPYTPGDAIPALGDAPLLAARIKIRKTAPHKHLLSLLNMENKGVHLDLTTQFIYSLRKLLCDVTKTALWDLGLEMTPATDLPGTKFSGQLI